MLIEKNKKYKNYFNGFMITEDYKIIEKYNNEKETFNGCYVLLKDGKITQDFFGCFGIYIYQKDDYFVLSDNLYELLSFLKCKITLNKNYYKKIINAREVSFTPEETICNEIKRYNGSYEIFIKNNELKIVKKNFNINKINYTDIEYYKILDSWYFDWLKILSKLKNKIVIEDLSGGIDTRILLSMAINSNMLDYFLFRNKKGTLNQEAIQDTEIAQTIIKNYNIKEVNKIFIDKEKNLDYNYVVGNSNFTTSINTQPIKKIYRLCGNGGLLYHRPQTFKKLLDFRFSKVDEWLKEEYNKYYNSIKIPEYINEENLKQLYIYRKLIVELRDGIKSADYFRSNTIMLCPMMDPRINLLNPLNEKGEAVLPYIILKRYCPELLKFPIEGIKEKNLGKVNVKGISFKKNRYETNLNKNVFFFRYKRKKINNDGSHSTGTDFHLIDNLLGFFNDN